MKKRILSVLLAVLVMLSSMPMIYAISLSGSGTADNPYLISSKDDFKKFLRDAPNTTSLTYYKFTNDIVLDFSDDYITGKKCNNIVLDGNGYYIKGASFINAMFSELNNSTIKNINFDDCYTTNTEPVSHMALLAQKCNDINSYVTNCIFTECYIQFSYGGNRINSGFVVAENKGTITNCIVKDSQLYEDFSEGATDTGYNIGGIVGKNLVGDGFGTVSNCISDVVFNLEEFHPDSSFGGIADINQDGWIKNCYSEAKTNFDVKFNEIVNVNSSADCVSDCCYKKDEKFYLYGSDSVWESDAYSLAATLSNAAAAYNDVLIDAIVPDNYACMWTVKEYKENLKTVQELDLSFDGKTAVILTNIDKNFYNSEDINSVSVSVTDKTGFSVFQKDKNGNPLVYAVKVGAYGDDGYERNKMTVEFVLKKDYSMVNDISLSPTNESSKKIKNVFDEQKNNYSTVFYTPATKKDESGLKSKFTIDVLPVNSKMKISTDSSEKVVSDYCFVGAGDENSPFIISDEYELRCLSHHVANGKKYTDKNNSKVNFSKAHYKLVDDIEMSDDPFTPIGLNTDGGNTCFEGVFDGGAHTISNLVIDATIHYQGLFGVTKGQKNSDGSYTEKAVIKNLNVFDADIKEKDTSNPADIKGIIVGRAEGTVVKGCVTNGTISGGTQIAGVVGYAYYSDVFSCGSTATVNGYSPKSWIGGIVANAGHSKVENCYFAGTVNAEYVLNESFVELGSIVAYNKGSEFNNNYYKDNCLYLDSICKSEATTAYGILENESTLKSDDFMDNLYDYSLDNNHQVYWKKVNGINSGYPINCSAYEAYHYIYCKPSIGGVITTDVSKAKAGETITVSNENGHNELNGIKVYDTQNKLISEHTNVVDQKVTFTMPACSVNVVPSYDMALFSGLGTENNPFQIATYEDLVLLSDVVYNNTTYYIYDSEGNPTTYYYNSAHYEVVNDIDCDGKEMYPIGHQSASFRTFRGVFDGLGHCISDLNIVRRDTYYEDTMGLFSMVDGATIRNLDLRQISVDYTHAYSNHKKTVSVLGGYFTDSDLINISIYDCVIKNAGYAGVLCTDIRGDVSCKNILVDGVTFDSCDTVSLVSDEISGTLKTDIFSMKNCAFMNVDGINSGISRSFNDSVYPAEVVCENNFYQSDIDISEDNVINAVAKTNEELLSNKFVADLSYYAQTVLNEKIWGKNSDAELGISIEREPRGISKIIYDDKFNEDGAIKFFPNTEDLPQNGYDGQIIELMYNVKMSLDDFDIKNGDISIPYSIKFDNENSEYGYIVFAMPEGFVSVTNNNKEPIQKYLSGHGIEEDPYLITDSQDLLLFKSVMSGEAVQQKLNPKDPDFKVAYFRVTQDIDMSGIIWNGIGDSETPFSGVFDGNTKTINIPSLKGSLFAFVEGGTVKNLNLRGGTISYSGSSEQIGSVVDYAKNATISNVVSYVSIQSPYLYIEYTIGGIVGWADNTVIERCIYFGNINSKNADTTNQQGGIAGKISGNSKVINCANNGNISGTSFSRVGGIAGYSYNGVVVKNCYNYGSVSGKSSVGAIFGYVKDFKESNISDNYYLNNTGKAFGNVSGSDTTAVSKTSSAFASGEVAYLLNNKVSDGTQVWYQNINNDQTPDKYPVLDAHGTVYSGEEFNCKGEKISSFYSNTKEDQRFVDHIYNDNGVCTVCGQADPSFVDKLAGHSLSLGENIAVNYYMILTEKTLSDENAKMVFTVPDTGVTYTEEIPVSKAVKHDDYYVFTCKVAAKEMTSVISSKLVTSNSELQLEDYTVQQYADVILSDTTKYANEQNLVKAMLNYGAYAQLYFNYNTNNLANSILDEADKVLVDTPDLSAYASSVSGEQEGVSFYGGVLSLMSETAIKLYFRVDCDINTLHITVNGEEAEAVKNGDYYEIKISDIPAHKLDDMFEVKVGGLTVIYGVFSYGNKAMDTDKDTLKNVVKAMYAYNQSANDYVD